MSAYSLTSSRCIALLDSLLDQHGAQGFGRIMQKLLAHCFRREGYWVLSNAIGVPDFVAVRPGSTEGFAVEAKTATGGKLHLNDRELKGVTLSEHRPVVAVLLFPDLIPRWICLDAHALRAGDLSVPSLVRKPLVQLDFDLDDGFRSVLAEFHEAAMASSYVLNHVLLREEPRSRPDPLPREKRTGPHYRTMIKPSPDGRPAGGRPAEWLHGLAVAALQGSLLSEPMGSELEHKPLELELASPLPRRTRLYVYTATDPPGERSVGDFKIQLIVPGQERGKRGRFDFAAADAVLLVGLVELFDVFVLWDAGLHDDFPYSKNVQVHPSTVHQAAMTGLAYQKRQIRGRGIETIVASRSSLLRDAIQRRLTLTARRLADIV